MELFQCESSNLLILSLKTLVEHKLKSTYTKLYTNSKLKQSFRQVNWADRLKHLKRKTLKDYRAYSDLQHINSLYKKCTAFYLRSTCQRTSVSSVPKLHVFVHKFMQNVLNAMTEPVYFQSYQYADQIEFLKAMLRVTLHDMFVSPLDNSLSVTVFPEDEQQSTSSDSERFFPDPVPKSPAAARSARSAPPVKLSTHNQIKDTKPQVGTTHRSLVSSRKIPRAVSLGPGDSVSVAPYSSLQPKALPQDGTKIVSLKEGVR